MAKYNFDEKIVRKGTWCTKWDSLKERFGCDSLISMWIADMDFNTPKFFTDALVKRISDGVLGYGCRPKEWYDSISNWLSAQYGWKVKTSQIGFVSGIVLGLSHALRCFTKKGDRVLITPPVYFPFKNQILAAGCKVVNSKLQLNKKTVKGEEKFTLDIDWDDFEKKIATCKVFILCNPHNPGGRVWKLQELKKIAALANKYKVMVISDEIHCDLSFKKHIPFAKVDKKAAQNCITFRAPSKTFNCAGLCASEWIIENPKMFDKFQTYLRAGAFDEGHCLAFYPSSILYSDKGREWIKQVNTYIADNIKFVEDYLKKNFTVTSNGKTRQLVSMIEPEASFLIFLNFRELKLKQSDLVDLVVGKAHLALNDGETFGPGGEGFMRLNVGCPRDVLKKALSQLKSAVFSI